MARSRGSQDLGKMATTIFVKMFQFSTVFTLLSLNSPTSLSFCAAEVIEEMHNEVNISHFGQNLGVEKSNQQKSGQKESILFLH
jgi:hypothetical protein